MLLLLNWDAHKSIKNNVPKIKTVAFVNSIDPGSALFSICSLNSDYDIIWIIFFFNFAGFTHKFHCLLFWPFKD